MRTVDYGEHPEQVGDLYLPAGDGLFAVVVLVHGGFWRQPYRRDLMTALAEDLLARGYAVWNIEYRRVGGSGGYPETLTDAAAAIDHLARLDGVPLDLDRVVTVGHSAGGHLALWLAGRQRLATGAPGADPQLRPCAAVGQAGVSDLAQAARLGLGGDAVRDFLGGTPDDVPDRYAVADPARLLPLGVPQLLVHSEGDTTVSPQLSRDYAAVAASVGDDVTLALTPGGHFVHLDPSHRAWQAVVTWLADACPP